MSKSIENYSLRFNGHPQVLLVGATEFCIGDRIEWVVNRQIWRGRIVFLHDSVFADAVSAQVLPEKAKWNPCLLKKVHLILAERLDEPSEF